MKHTIRFVLTNFVRVHRSKCHSRASTIIKLTDIVIHLQKGRHGFNKCYRIASISSCLCLNIEKCAHKCVHFNCSTVCIVLNTYSHAQINNMAYSIMDADPIRPIC